MPRHHTITELSSSSGEDLEGFDVGHVNQSNFVEMLSSVSYASAVYAYQRDRAAGSTRYLDVTAEVRSAAANDVSPWGAVAEMSAGDALIVACDDLVAEIHLDITTAGVGSWTGLKVFDSSNGSTFNRELTVTDETGGLKNAGVRRIVVTPPSPESASFSPVPEDIASRRWLAIVPDGPITTVTTVPRIGRLYLKQRASQIAYQGNSGATVLNAVLTDSNWSSLPTEVLVTEGTETMFVLPFVAYRLDWAIHRRALDTFTQAWEYLATDDTWKPLPNLVDASNAWKNGPVALGDPITNTNTRWSLPVDWTSKTLALPQTGGGTISVTGYMVRARVATITQRVQASPAAFRGRVRALGPANARGITEEAAVTYRWVQLLRIGQQNGAVTADLLNLHAGKSATFTVPAGAVPGQRLALSVPLALDAREQRDFLWVSGGQLHQVDIYLES